MTRHFLIDTDTASDDAVALVLAMQHPGVQIEAITVVAGNVPVDQGVQNALYTVELCGQSIPVYRGMPGPLIRPLETAQSVHGQDGMGDIGLPLTGRSPAPAHAVQVLIDTIHQFAGDITLVTLGPLTNIAVALRQDPSIAQAVSECIIMGGTGRGHGNVTPVAEYNFWVDPEAAQIVFESGMPIKMVGWDISRTYAVLGPGGWRGAASDWHTPGSLLYRYPEDGTAVRAHHDTIGRLSTCPTPSPWPSRSIPPWQPTQCAASSPSKPRATCAAGSRWSITWGSWAANRTPRWSWKHRAIGLCRCYSMLSAGHDRCSRGVTTRITWQPGR